MDTEQDHHEPERLGEEDLPEATLPEDNWVDPITAGKRVIGEREVTCVYFDFEGRRVFVPVADEIFNHFERQFLLRNRSPDERKRLITMVSMLRAAFRAGMRVGESRIDADHSNYHHHDD